MEINLLIRRMHSLVRPERNLLKGDFVENEFHFGFTSSVSKTWEEKSAQHVVKL